MRKLIIAAENGDAGAQFNLGVAFGNRADPDPQAIKRNRAESCKWLLHAARQGLPRAQIMLAERLAEDATNAGSSVRACAWYLVASTIATGIHRASAQTGYDRMSHRLTPTQVERAQHLARLWRPRKRRVVPVRKAVDRADAKHAR